MSRAWKPGDVAIRRTGPQITRPYEQITVAVEKCFNEAHDGVLHWHHASGGWDPLSAGEFGPTYRPLVVIDPEDRTQVGRVVRLFWENGTDDCDDPVAMQAALREFADPKPPKPAEPTGLGAVVETQPMIVNEDGDTASVLIRHADGLWWTNGEGGWYWADVPAVRVLSEGVQS